MVNILIGLAFVAMVVTPALVRLPGTNPAKNLKIQVFPRTVPAKLSL